MHRSSFAAQYRTLVCVRSSYDTSATIEIVAEVGVLVCAVRAVSESPIAFLRQIWRTEKQS